MNFFNGTPLSQNHEFRLIMKEISIVRLNIVACLTTHTDKNVFIFCLNLSPLSLDELNAIMVPSFSYLYHLSYITFGLVKFANTEDVKIVISWTITFKIIRKFMAFGTSLDFLNLYLTISYRSSLQDFLFSFIDFYRLISFTVAQDSNPTIEGSKLTGEALVSISSLPKASLVQLVASAVTELFMFLFLDFFFAKQACSY
ncbi:hypothetical protein WN51_03801 [Melipona quadrifasciata]|uniref:Uncharacterized protein n=1 Tax=Melipona quadrifasciata TaxID=166423 RepID=A0A0N0U467_9HYME|nr:hypothetical protein WN51_03801 [Melipona quadrifasciata]